MDPKSPAMPPPRHEPHPRICRPL